MFNRVLCGAGILLLPAVMLPAAVLHVPGGYPTIQVALDAAREGDTVLVAPGEYVITAPLNFNRQHDPSNPASPAARDLVLASEAGPAATTIRLSAAAGLATRASVVEFLHGETALSVLEGFTLTGGKGADDGAGARLGGGIFCGRSSPTLRSCIIRANRATAGGGLYAGGAAAPALINCVVAGNAAVQGGGVFVRSMAAARLENCTLAANTGDGLFCALDCVAGPGPGEFTCYGPFSVLTNCILWGNRGEAIGMDGGVGPKASYCCIGGDEVWPGKGNIDGDPLFVALGVWEDEDTPDDLLDDTWSAGDLRLQAGSPCIDAGMDAGRATADIEGYARPCGAHVDMGAYEFGECAVAEQRFMRGDTNADAKVDIADVIYTLKFLFAGGAPAGCRDAADANDDGQVDIADAVTVLNRLFGGGPPLPPPFGLCGLDLTIDALGCDAYPPCR